MATSHQTLFGEQIVRGALIGAALGFLGVLAGFAAFVVLADVERTVIGAAGLAAPFGGSGFGAMIGAVLGAIRAAELEDAPERPPR